MSFFGTLKKGDIKQLREDLLSDRRDKQKEALKEVINDITNGKNMSSLFADVVKLIQTTDIEMKKLIYLYLTNYASSVPDQALLAINTFIRDCEDVNPLVRSMAVRAMGCMCTSEFFQYLCKPLSDLLTDPDAYVRKTASVCVLKLFNERPDAAETKELVKQLQTLLLDPNPMVLTNTLAVLLEMAQSSDNPTEYLSLDMRLVHKLLTSIKDCTEWGQITILDTLTYYQCKNETEAQNICERITSRLSHVNTALVFATIKVLLKNVELLSSENSLRKTIFSKLSATLVSMVSLEREIQFVALRNINLIIQKYPEILRRDIRSFIIKYNDPIYIKIEKLEIMNLLADVENIDYLLNEIREYVREVDVDFVKRAVRSIGFFAVKIEAAADKCVGILVEIIKSKVPHIVRESVIVTMDIMRKYPNKYESIIDTISKNIVNFDEPESRSAFVWILGEYGDHIDNVFDILESFSNSFLDENYYVQLQILTTVVKVFLKHPVKTQDLLNNILSIATSQVQNLDVRDRAFVYWRLLSEDPAAAKQVVLVPKPPIANRFEKSNKYLDILLVNLSSLSSIYHKIPADFNQIALNATATVPSDNAHNSDSNLLISFDFNSGFSPDPKEAPQLLPFDQLIDFSSCDHLQQTSNGINSRDSKNIVDMLEGLNFETNFSSPKTDHFRDAICPQQSMWLTPETTNNMIVYGTFINFEDHIEAAMTIRNTSVSPITALSIELSPNFFGIDCSSQECLKNTLNSNEHEQIKLNLHFGENLNFSFFNDKDPHFSNITFTFKTNISVYSSTVLFPFNYYFIDPKDSNLFKLTLNQTQFSLQWNALASSNRSVKSPMKWKKDDCLHLFSSLHIYNIETCQPLSLCGMVQLRNGMSVFLLIDLSDFNTTISVRSQTPVIVPPVSLFLEGTFK